MGTKVVNIFGDLILKKTDREVKYWQSELNGAAPILDFPTDRSRLIFDNPASGNSHQNNTKQNLFFLDEDLSRTLLEIALENNSSLPVLLLTTFQVLLYKYTKQSDIIVGYLNWYKSSQEQLDLLPIRVAITDEINFLSLLALVKEQFSEANSHSNLSFDILTKALRGEQSELTIDYLSQMLFRYNDLNQETIQVIPSTKKIEQELFLDVVKKAEHLIFIIKYDCCLFDKSTIQRITDNYQVLLKSIAANPDMLLSSFPLLSVIEKQQVLLDWNQTQVQPALQCIHQLFETHVKQNPEATAIICQGEQLTYDELNQKANQLAHYLQDVGVTKGSLVGLCIERSLSMVVGIFAILKAGGAYVPLDISNPTARLAFILEDAGVKVLLAQEDLLTKLPAQIERTICIDRDSDAIDEYSTDNLELDLTISDLAHIVYTSGSTGKPKGVILTHGNLSHYAQSLRLAFEITPDDVYLHRGSIALIVSARQLLMPLAQGATALIVTTAETKNPLGFFALIKRYGVTIVDHVPSFWRNFWGILNQQDKAFRQNLLDNRVRLVAAGGEQVTPEIYQCWRETFNSNVKLANIYGQTEGTGVVTVYQIPDHLNRSFKSLPVGYPIPNMKVYLLDEELNPVPFGVTGEIHISGAGVAQGYLNRPKLTAEKFVENPYGEGQYLYRTGDLGCRLADGSIQFLGRRDRQVNIQGLRVELGEIEAVLSQNELVIEAAITVRENNLGEILAAYIIPNTKQPPTIAMLKSYLQQRLPAYMTPSTFVFLDTFPQTTSGKVDLRALAALDVGESERVIIAPRDRLESKIVEMLKDILGINEISIKDNFIELGGNSLLAARLVTEIEHQYEQKIPISGVFQAPTAEAIANLLRQDGQVAYPKTFVPIKLGNSQPSIFCIHYLGYGLEYYRSLVEHLNADISLYGLSVDFTDDPNVPHSRDIKGLAAYYVRELQQFKSQQPYYLLGVSFGGVVAYEMVRELIALGHEVKFLGLLDSHCPDQNLVSRIPSLKERAQYHLNNFRTRGMTHVLDKVERRWRMSLDELRCNLYNIKWIQKNFVDDTGREFAQAKYDRLRKEHQKVNKDYVLHPYSGNMTLFRADQDPDLKLEWQDFVSRLDIVDIPGKHLEIFKEPNVRILAEKITSALNHCQNNDVQSR